MLAAFFDRHFARRDWWHTAFIGGLGLSVIAIVALFGVAYFAGTAPRVPRAAAALETLQPPGASSVSPVEAQPLGHSIRALPVDAAAGKPSLALPGAGDRSQAPPIDVSDLPPPDHRLP